jgi:phenylalanyl-tRNA synthetase beta chain
VDFFDAKAYVADVLSVLGVPVVYTPVDEFGMVPGRTAEIQAGGQRIGVVAQVHPDVCAAFEIDQEVFMFEIVLDDALQFVIGTRKASTVSRFPPIEQDLALIVDADTPAASLQAAIASSSLVREARVFDVYAGGQIPPGKKSIAFSVLYQSDERTLTDEDVAKAQRKIVERLRREFAAELRG